MLIPKPISAFWTFTNDLIPFYHLRFACNVRIEWHAEGSASEHMPFPMRLKEKLVLATLDACKWFLLLIEAYAGTFSWCLNSNDAGQLTELNLKS